MAESGTSSKGIGKVFQKTVIRTREKVLQNLGKADKTRDDELEQHVVTFNEQQTTSSRLQKDIKHYQTCVKEMSLASQNMYRSIKETYDPSWLGYTETVSSIELLSTLWDDYLAQLQEKLYEPLMTYAANFPEMKSKISKRGRKLTDYDSARHNYEASTKKQDESKIAKTLDELNEAKHIYETINTELHEELPALYQSRILFLATYFNSLFNIEAVFHRESAKLKETMADVTDRLCHDEGERNSGAQPFKIKPTKSMIRNSLEADQQRTPGVAVSPSTSGSQFNRHPLESNTSYKNSNVEAASSSPRSPADPSPPSAKPRPDRPPGGGPGDSVIMTNGGDRNNSPRNNYDVPLNNSVVTTPRDHAGLSMTNVVSTHNDDDDEENGESDGEVKPVVTTTGTVSPGENPYSLATATEDVYKLPPSNEPVVDTEEARDIGVGARESGGSVGLNNGARILFQVIATHRYVGDDVDELSFEPGDVITVVPFDNPEDQDEGWLTGIKESTREKGVFPENFTKRL